MKLVLLMIAILAVVICVASASVNKAKKAASKVEAKVKKIEKKLPASLKVSMGRSSCSARRIKYWTRRLKSVKSAVEYYNTKVIPYFEGRCRRGKCVNS